MSAAADHESRSFAWMIKSDADSPDSRGVRSIHGLLVSVLEYIRSTGRWVIEPQPYSDAMQDALLELDGDTRNSDVVRGSDFWLARRRRGCGEVLQQHGAAGAHGKAGQRAAPH
jgi:hypothetical protein